jgi:hypothetical protein
MPFTPQKIKERVTRVSFTIGGEPFWLEYRAAVVEALTQEKLERWQEEAGNCSTDEEQHRYVAGILCELISAWDVVESIDDEGKPGPMLPLTVDTVVSAGLDDGFLMRCLAEMTRNAQEVKVGGTA